MPQRNTRNCVFWRPRFRKRDGIDMLWPSCSVFTRSHCRKRGVVCICFTRAVPFVPFISPFTLVLWTQLIVHNFLRSWEGEIWFSVCSLILCIWFKKICYLSLSIHALFFFSFFPGMQDYVVCTHSCGRFGGGGVLESSWEWWGKSPIVTCWRAERHGLSMGSCRLDRR